MYIYLFNIDFILKRSQALDPRRFIKSLLFLWKRAIARRVCCTLLLGCLMLSLWSASPSLAKSAPLFIAEATSSAETQPEALPQADSGEGDRPSPRGSADISSETLNRFVTAYRQVLNLVEERADELRRAETETASLRIQRDLENEAIATIEDAGLTWQEYVQLLSLANSDADLSERIVTQLQELGTLEEKNS